MASACPAWGCSALAALAARMEPKDAASVADRLAKALGESAGNRWRAPVPLGRDAGSVGSADGAQGRRKRQRTQVLAKALENPQETNGERLSSLGQALAALAARMEPKEAASVADASGQGAGESEGNRCASACRAWGERAGSVGSADGAQGRRKASRPAVLAKALENPQETDAERLSSLGQALAALAARMEPKEAASVAARGAQVLAKALENPQETDGERLSSLGQALAALAARMEPKEAASVAARGAQVLAKALENSQETDARRLSSLGWSLGGLARLIPPARQTQLAALSNMLLEEVSGTPKQGEEEPEKRKQLADLYALLDAQDLAEVLKWPFCVGEAEKIALAELEKKTGRKFGGDIWKFVEQAPSLGIKDLDAPAKRPKVEDALKELKSIATAR